MHSCLSSFASNFFHLSRASSWNSASHMVGVACVWLVWEGVAEMLDNISRFSVDSRPLLSGSNSTEKLFLVVG